MRRLVAIFASLIAVAAALPAQAAGPTDGKYGCYTYAGGKANHVGEMSLKGKTYIGFPQETGTYRYDEKSNMVHFDGPPPLGFKLAVMETDPHSRIGRLRLYREPSDVGQKTKALLCSPK